MKSTLLFRCEVAEEPLLAVIEVKFYIARIDRFELLIRSPEPSISLFLFFYDFFADLVLVIIQPSYLDSNVTIACS